MPIPYNIPTPQTIIDAAKSMTPYTKAVKISPNTNYEACRAFIFNSSISIKIYTVDDQDNPITNFPVISGQIYKISAVRMEYTGSNAFFLY